MGTAERREREKQQRRNTILDSAEKVFFSKGIQVATMDDVAEASEFSKGTLYLYFKNKADLYIGITERALSKLRNLFEKAFASHVTGIEKVRAIGEAYIHFSQTYTDYFNMISQYEMAHISLVLEPEQMEACHVIGRQVIQVVANAVEHGIKDGTIRKDLDPVKTAFLLQGVSSGMIHMMSREKEHLEKLENIDMNDLKKEFFNFVFNAIENKNSKN